MPTRRGADPEVVVVTGASGGVGRAVAHAFARRGARLGLIARDRSGLDAACAEVAAIVGNRIAPGFADRYLARNGFRAQQDERRPVGPREGNLFVQEVRSGRALVTVTTDRTSDAIAALEAADALEVADVGHSDTAAHLAEEEEEEDR